MALDVALDASEELQKSHCGMRDLEFLGQAAVGKPNGNIVAKRVKDDTCGMVGGLRPGLLGVANAFFPPVRGHLGARAVRIAMNGASNVEV
jgi:hypothetical protein